MGGSSAPSRQTVINKTELPKWVDAAAQKNLGIADQLAQRPYQPYGGQIAPGASQLQNEAFGNALATAGMYRPGMWAAGDTAFAGTQWAPQSFLSGNVGAYMNPYIQNVENRAIANQNRAFADNINQIGDRATSAAAFGGSRHGIAEGVAAAENARNIGDLSAQLRAQGYQDAAGRLEGDITRDMQGQQMRSEDAVRLAQISNSGQEMEMRDTTLLSALGEQQRGIESQLSQEDYAKFKEALDYPLQQLNLRLAALGATPYGGTQTQTTTGQAGGGSTGLQLFGSALSILPMLFGLSDEREKTDIEEVGKDPETGLMLYAYRYKDDPKTYPKVVGPMAQEVEKKFPSAVKNVGGKKLVANMGFGGGL